MTQLKGQLLDFQSAGLPAAADTVLTLGGREVPASYDKDGRELRADVGGKIYLVRGNPSLSSVRTFVLGIRNRGDVVLTGENELWVNELTVDNVRARRALSGLLNMRTVLADLGNLNVEVERRSGDFQDLQGSASGNTSTRLVLSSTLNLDRFLPRTWQAAIPFNYDFARTSQIPRIRSGSDIVLTADQKVNESDVSDQSRVNLSFRKTPAQEKPRLTSRIFFDRVNASLSYVSNTNTGGAITRRRSLGTDALTGSFMYDLTIPQKHSVKPFTWVPLVSQLREADFFLLPPTLRYSARVTRNLRDQTDFSAVAGDTSGVIATNTENFTLNESYEAKLQPFRSINAGYTLGTTRDLRGALKPSSRQFGHEVDRTESFTLGYTPQVFRWLNANGQYNASYRENLETGGQRVSVGNIRRGLTVSTQNQASLRLGFNVQTLFRPLADLGKGNALHPLGLIGRAGGAVSNVSVSGTRSKQAGLFGLRQSPGARFRMGFTDSARVPTFQTNSLTRADQSSVTNRLDASASVRLPLGFSLSSNANYAHTDRIGNAATEDRTTTLPDLNVQWRDIERLPVFRWIWTSANVNTTYQRLFTKTGEGGLDSLTITNDREQTQFSPLVNLSTRWKNGLSTTFRTNRSRQSDLKYQRNVSADSSGAFPTLDARLIGTTITTTSEFTTEMRYSLSPRIFETLQSSIDLTLDFKMGSSLAREIPRAAPGEEAAPFQTTDQTTIGGQLGAQYRFSSHFTGGLNFRHERTNDRIRDLTNVVYEFRVFGEIEFN
jgi:hypothetical protein